MDKEAVACKAVDAVMKKMGVRRLVMGHTPHFAHILSRCDGKIIIIDTGEAFVTTIVCFGGADDIAC